MKKLFLIFGLMVTSVMAHANVISVGQIVYPTVSIASGQTTSGIVSTAGMELVGCQLPATLTGTALTFTVATTITGTYQPLYNSAGQVSYTVAGGSFIAINAADFAGVQFFKIVSNSSEGAARTLVCSMKGI